MRKGVKNRFEFMAHSRGPFGEARFINGGYSGILPQPNAVKRILNNCENLVGWQALLRVYRADAPILEPAQAASGADPKLIFFIDIDRIDNSRLKAFVSAEMLHLPVG